MRSQLTLGNDLLCHHKSRGTFVTCHLTMQSACRVAAARWSLFLLRDRACGG